LTRTRLSGGATVFACFSRLRGGPICDRLSLVATFEAMNTAYVEKMGDHRPARTVIGVRELPKPAVLLTMNLTAVTDK
jgi:hypothetical protein